MKKKDKLELKNPPAIEVVFDIQFAEEEGLSTDNFKVSGKAFNKRFSAKDGLNFFESQIDQKKNKVSNCHMPYGIVYKNEDNRELTQFRLNGFSYHNLKDYTGWSNFIDNAMHVLNIYNKCRTAHEYKRLGLRFINLIKIPKSCNDLSKYFSINLNLSTNKNSIGNVTLFRYTYLSEIQKFNCTSTVNFIQQPSSTIEEYKSFILDIDVAITDFKPTINDATLRENFENMRKAKNEIFRSHLTTKAIEMFK